MTSNSHKPCSLVLAAHGSQKSPSANATYEMAAAWIRSQGQFEVVTPAYLNGQPEISKVLNNLPAGEVVVVPMMTSEGYYSQTVFPRELSNNTRIGEFDIRVTRALGLHRNLAVIVAGRIEDLLLQNQLNGTETTIVVVGHGTTRHPNSGEATENLSRKIGRELSRRHIFSEVTVGFIDQSPNVNEVARTVVTRNLIVIPFLFGLGPHATEDVPEAFGFESDPNPQFPLKRRRDHGVTLVDFPVGLYPEIPSLCLQLATEKPSKQHHLPQNSVPKPTAPLFLEGLKS